MVVLGELDSSSASWVSAADAVLSRRSFGQVVSDGAAYLS